MMQMLHMVAKHNVVIVTQSACLNNQPPTLGTYSFMLSMLETELTVLWWPLITDLYCSINEFLGGHHFPVQKTIFLITQLRRCFSFGLALNFATFIGQVIGEVVHSRCIIEFDKHHYDCKTKWPTAVAKEYLTPSKVPWCNCLWDGLFSIAEDRLRGEVHLKHLKVIVI